VLGEWLKSLFTAPRPRRADGEMNYTILIEQQESVDGWTVCTICLNVDRTAAVARKRWRCPDCGIDASNNTQQPLAKYLVDNPPSTLEKNLREWGNVKGVRAAYRMLRSARYKCLLTLSRRQPPTAL
jgi:transposase-like protein